MAGAPPSMVQAAAGTRRTSVTTSVMIILFRGFMNECPFGLQGPVRFRSRKSESRAASTAAAGSSWPSAKRMRYGSPDMDDFVAHRRMKSSAVLIWAFCIDHFSRRWASAAEGEWASPLRMNVAPWSPPTKCSNDSNSSTGAATAPTSVARKRGRSFSIGGRCLFKGRVWSPLAMQREMRQDVDGPQQFHCAGLGAAHATFFRGLEIVVAGEVQPAVDEVEG